jgi:hypothetical protein
MACGPCRYRKDRTWPKRCRAEWGACAQRCPRASGTQRGKTSCAVQMVEPILRRMVEPILRRTWTQRVVLSFCEQHVSQFAPAAVLNSTRCLCGFPRVSRFHKRGAYPESRVASVCLRSHVFKQGPGSQTASNGVKRAVLYFRNFWNQPPSPIARRARPGPQTKPAGRRPGQARASTAMVKGEQTTRLPPGRHAHPDRARGGLRRLKYAVFFLPMALRLVVAGGLSTPSAGEAKQRQTPQAKHRKPKPRQEHVGRVAAVSRGFMVPPRGLYLGGFRVFIFLIEDPYVGP